eukprot:767500-Hanusia_phi.AAC.2
MEGSQEDAEMEESVVARTKVCSVSLEVFLNHCQTLLSSFMEDPNDSAKASEVLSKVLVSFVDRLQSDMVIELRLQRCLNRRSWFFGHLTQTYLRERESSFRLDISKLSDLF